MLLPNYRVLHKIAETDRTKVYKAYHVKQPNCLLVLKTFRRRFMSESQEAGLRQRIEHLRILDSPLAVIPNTFEVQDDICYLTYDYFPGISLSELLASHSGCSPDVFFTIALKLAQVLTAVHDAGIIHGGVKPNNILVNPDTLAVRLIDFVSLADVSNVSPFAYEEAFVRGTLAYTSPEQTGRIRHRASFASDLYSLGIVFYEMLAGQLPFFHRDPLELIHAHLAEEAPLVHELNDQIPRTLSRIVGKLMAKEPERRYQSSRALWSDLKRCRDEYLSSGKISDFSLATFACTTRVNFVSKMVGRKKEAETLLRLYQEAADGEFRALFISGVSGIGKTRLIQELQGPIVREKGYFTSGKFDVYQRDIPYSAIIQALRRLMRIFLTESDRRVAMWKERILQAVGRNGRVLTEVIPELETLIGPQPELKPLPPVEALHRFRDTFDRFLGCLATEENPLTIFIDDLQWCDTATIEFLAYLLANYQEHPYLFFLGAYRSDEVDFRHPVTRLICQAKQAGRHVVEMQLGPLKPEDCYEMVSYILNAPLSQTRALSDFISELSEGNPLYVTESLTYFWNEGLLFRDEAGQWRWDMAKIRRSNMPRNVVALFCSKISKLPQELIDLLEYCACMGNVFSPEELALLHGMTLLDTFQVLQPALKQGLLIESQNTLQFVHDKVQEAVLLKIPQARRRRIHWQIGQYLLSHAPKAASIEKENHLFTIVSHLNMGQPDDLDGKSRYLLSRLNYHAGDKALASLATEAANEYFNLSLSLLPDDCWDDAHYQLTFRVYQRAAKTELMCGNYTRSEQLLTTLLQHARTDLDKAECLAEQTTCLASIGELTKAIDTAKQGLKYIGVDFPNSEREIKRMQWELMEELIDIGTDVYDTVLHMPFTEDRKSQIELLCYSALIPCLYATGRVDELYVAAAQAVKNCLAGGMDESVIYAFAIMGLQFAEQGNYELAFCYEDLARQLSAMYPNTFGAI